MHSNTMNEVKGSVDSLQRSMRASYLDILARVRGLENQRASSLLETSVVSKTDIEEHRGCDYDLSGDNTATERSISRSSRTFTHIFEKDLALTRLYKRIMLRGSFTSNFTTERPETRWSTISDLSVADVISRLSVYELAITPSEIHKSQQYAPFAGDGSQRISSACSIRTARPSLSDKSDADNFGTLTTLTEATETRYSRLREAKAIETLWGFQDLPLPESTIAVVKDVLSWNRMPPWRESEYLKPRLFLIRFPGTYYAESSHVIILRDQVANALQYFERNRDAALSMTTDQFVPDVLRMLGVLRPGMESFEIEEHTLYILYNAAVIQQRQQAMIHRLTPKDAPLGLIRTLQIKKGNPRLILQPKAIELPANGSIDVTDMDLGYPVDGWLLHRELHRSHVRHPKHSLMRA